MTARAKRRAALAKEKNRLATKLAREQRADDRLAAQRAAAVSEGVAAAYRKTQLALACIAALPDLSDCRHGLFGELQLWAMTADALAESDFFQRDEGVQRALVRLQGAHTKLVVTPLPDFRSESTTVFAVLGEVNKGEKGVLVHRLVVEVTCLPRGSPGIAGRTFVFSEVIEVSSKDPPPLHFFSLFISLTEMGNTNIICIG